MNGRTHHGGDFAPAQGWFAAPAKGDLAQRRRPACQKARLPKPDGRLTYFQLLANGFAALAFVGQQDDPRPFHDALRSISRFHPAFELLHFGVACFDW